MESLSNGVKHMRITYENHLQKEAEQQFEEQMKSQKEIAHQLEIERQERAIRLAEEKAIEAQYVTAFLESKQGINFDVDPSKLKYGNTIEIAQFGSGCDDDPIRAGDADAKIKIIANNKSLVARQFCSNEFVLQRCKIVEKVVKLHIEPSDKIDVYCKFHDYYRYGIDNGASLRLFAKQKLQSQN